MSRSVSTPRGASHVAYAAIDPDNVDDFESEVIDPLTYSLQKAFPSLYPDDTWLDREDQAILRNRHAQFGLSEYCGLIAVWVVPDEDSNLAAQWCSSIEVKLDAVVAETFGWRLRRIGTASNGESFFERVD